jgi:hypothetical protein
LSKVSFNILDTLVHPVEEGRLNPGLKQSLLRLKGRVRVLNRNFFARCVDVSSPDRGVWPLKSRNHLFSAIHRRRKLSGLWWQPFGTDPPIGLN